jgi:predicted transcriptional regulator
MANTPQFTMRLDPDLRAKLQHVADQQNRTLANVIDTLLRQALETDRKRVKK